MMYDNNDDNNVIVEYVDEKAKLLRLGKSSGYDVLACIKGQIVLEPLARCLVPTGIKMKLPHNMECQVRPIKYNAWKYGFTVLDAPSTIDEDFHGEVSVVLINLSRERVIIKPYDKIAHFVFSKVKRPKFIKVTPIKNIFGSIDK